MKRSMKRAFTLIELLIALIVISCIVAAFAPVMTKRMKNSIGVKSKNDQNFKLYLVSTPGGTYNSSNNNYTFTFKVPQGVTKINVAAVGAGSGGAGGTAAKLIQEEVSTDCIYSGGKYSSTPNKRFEVVDNTKNVRISTIAGGSGGGNSGYFSSSSEKLGCKTTISEYQCSSGTLINTNQCLVSAQATCAMVNGGTIYGTPILTKDEITQYGNSGLLYPYNIWVPNCGAKVDYNSDTANCMTNSGTSFGCKTMHTIYYIASASLTSRVETRDPININGSSKCINTNKATCAMVNGGTIYGTPILTKDEISQYSGYIYPYQEAWVPYCGSKVDYNSASSSCTTSMGSASCTSQLAIYYLADPVTVVEAETIAYGGGGGGSGAYAHNTVIQSSSCRLPVLDKGDTVLMNAGAGGAGTGASGTATTVMVTAGGKYYYFTAQPGTGGGKATSTGGGTAGSGGNGVSCSGAASGSIPTSLGAPGKAGGAFLAGTGGLIAATNGGDGGLQVSASQPTSYLNGKPGMCGKVTVTYDRQYRGAAGAGGGAGGLIHVKQISVTPGQTCTVKVGKGGLGGAVGSDGSNGGISSITCGAYVISAGNWEKGHAGAAQTDLNESGSQTYDRQGSGPTTGGSTYISTPSGTYINATSASKILNKEIDVIKFVNGNDGSDFRIFNSIYALNPRFSHRTLNDATYDPVTQNAIGGNGTPSPMDPTKFACGGLNQDTGDIPCNNSEVAGEDNRRFRNPDIIGDTDYGYAGAGGAGGGWLNLGGPEGYSKAGKGSDGQNGYVYIYWDKPD